MFFIGCGAQMDIPADFVSVGRENLRGYDQRAISADGVVVALRTLANEQNGDIEFWAVASGNELVQNRGHELVKTEDVTSGSGLAGKLMTFKAEKRGQDFIYLTALYIKADQIVLAEAGGKAEAFEAHADKIRKALLSVR